MADFDANSTHMSSARGVVRFAALADQSWVKHMICDPDEALFRPNKKSRQVMSGHYVPVLPTPLPQPQLLAVSPDVAKLVGIDMEGHSSEEFLRFFSGDVAAIPGFISWATPYALSIYGEPMIQNCPFGTGNGYGDGRAISVAEVLVPDDDSTQSQRWELQLKGSGTTPFCRTADGRAVLRSSIREFLAEEAMYHLGVSTTRGLSLIKSETETVKRPWFSANMSSSEKLDIDDPRIRHLPIQQRRMLVDQVNRERASQPNVMIEEVCAMACRVAPSFLRVGHVELMSRRFAANNSAFNRKQLQLLVDFVMYREFGGPAPASDVEESDADFQQRALEMLRQSSRNIALLTADWIRVGFCQGNFNSDNCLIAGRTMDYGPFGFIEKFEKTWNMWSGGGVHYSFRNQHYAGTRNFESLAQAVSLLFDPAGMEAVEEIMAQHESLAHAAVQDVFRRKLGLSVWSPQATALLTRIEDLMETAAADYTIFWRQLSILPAERLTEDHLLIDEEIWFSAIAPDALLLPFNTTFYTALSTENSDKLVTWLKDWLLILRRDILAQRMSMTSLSIESGSTEDVVADESKECSSVSESSSLTGANVSASMRQASPKYVPREWMLVEAYKAAERNDMTAFHKLQTLFQRPYEEQPEYEELFYRKMEIAQMGKFGLSHMT